MCAETKYKELVEISETDAKTKQTRKKERSVEDDDDEWLPDKQVRVDPVGCFSQFLLIWMLHN